MNNNKPILLGYAEDVKPIFSAFGIAPDMPIEDYYVAIPPKNNYKLNN